MRDARADGAELAVDLGDSLYPHAPPTRSKPGEPIPADPPPTAAEVARAHLILQFMGETHYSAMVVGDSDLANGLADLQDAASEAHVALLGGNLQDVAGHHPFGDTLVVSTARGQVGLLGLSKFVPNPGVGIAATDPIPAAKAAVAALQAKHVTAIVALLHMKRTDAEELVRSVPGIDLALVAHEGASGVAIASPPTYSVGQKGRDLVRVDLDLAPGPAQDASEIDQVGYELKQLAANRDRLQQNLARLGDGGGVGDGHLISPPFLGGIRDDGRARGQILAQLQQLSKREGELVAMQDSGETARMARAHHVQLTTEVRDSPAEAERVAQNISQYGHTPGH